MVGVLLVDYERTRVAMTYEELVRFMISMIGARFGMPVGEKLAADFALGDP